MEINADSLLIKKTCTVLFVDYLINTIIKRWINNSSLALVRERTIPIERPPFVGEVSATATFRLVP
jgi:hypothetical protein